MPVRATKRGAERTPFASGADTDVLICGASFAGLAVARELRRSGARVLVLDRYEIGERQTSACAAPTEWLANSGLEALDPADLRRAGRAHAAARAARWPLPFTFSTFDYRAAVRVAVGAVRGRGVRDREGRRSHRARRPHRPRRRAARAASSTRSAGAGCSGRARTSSRPTRALSRGLEVHPSGRGDELELWIDPRYVSPGYGWSFPAGDEVRIGVGSFDPRFHVKEPTLQLAEDVARRPCASRATGSRTGCAPAVEDGIFFVGDSAGHCLPLTAEGIRTALYFGIACGRELAAVVAGRTSRGDALDRLRALLGVAPLEVPRDVLRPAGGAPRSTAARWTRARPPVRPPRASRDWAFGHYLTSRRRSSSARRRRQRATTGSRRRRRSRVACRVDFLVGSQLDTS